MKAFPTSSIVAECMAMVAPAESAFRSRWRLSTLQRLDPELHQLLVEQIDLYERSLITGTDNETREQSEAMVRGWKAAVTTLEDPLRPDDAYLTGYDAQTNLVVVIAEQSGSVARAQVKNGQKVITVTPDEVAKLVAGMNLIASAKNLFPDAEVVRFTRRCSDEEMEAGDASMKHESVKAAQV